MWLIADGVDPHCNAGIALLENFHVFIIVGAFPDQDMLFELNRRSKQDGLFGRL